MEMRPRLDIAGYEDLLLLVETFYKGLLVDPEIGHFFTEVVALDLEHHLPRIASFWEMVLFQRGSYVGDPMSKHLQLDALSPMTGRHFEVWLGHFHSTVDVLFEGERAELAKQRAYSIAMLMQAKLAKPTFGK